MRPNALGLLLLSGALLVATSRRVQVQPLPALEAANHRAASAAASASSVSSVSAPTAARGPKPPLCDDAVVAETCAVLVPDGGDIVKVEAVQELLSATPSSAEEFWAELSLPGAGASCSELCFAVVATLAQLTELPPSCDVGCITLDGQTECDVDLDPVALEQETRFPGDLPDFHDEEVMDAATASALAETRAAFGEEVRAKKLDYEVPDMLRRIANLYRIYPSANVDAYPMRATSPASSLAESFDNASRATTLALTPAAAVSGPCRPFCSEHRSGDCFIRLCKGCSFCIAADAPTPVPTPTPAPTPGPTPAPAVSGPCRPFCSEHRSGDCFMKLCKGCSFCTPPAPRSSDWRRPIMEVNLKAIQYVKTALTRGSARQTQASITKWFGRDAYTDTTTSEEVLRVLNSIDSMLGNVDYVYPGPLCGPRTFAYVFPQGHDCSDRMLSEGNRCTKNRKGQFVFYLCDLALDSPVSTQIETFTHEASHHATAYTRDVLIGEVKQYGRDNCERLARTDPSTALQNADNFCYYIQDVTDMKP